MPNAMHVGGGIKGVYYILALVILSVFQDNVGAPARQHTVNILARGAKPNSALDRRLPPTLMAKLP